MQTHPRTPISKIGKFGLIERILGSFSQEESASPASAQVLFLEGIHFDLTYTPLQHLGYKAVVRALGQVMAMNVTPHHLLVAVGLSKRFFVEDVEQLFVGIKSACNEHQIKLVGLDFESSYTGLTLSVTAMGVANKPLSEIPKDGKPTDLLCVTGNLGAAYMGLQLLEREKALFSSKEKAQPQLLGKEYILQRYLRPTLCTKLFTILHQEEITPTSICFLTNGLAHGVQTIAATLGCGAKIYVEKIPIATKTFEMAQELNHDALLCALNGGDDYEFLLSLPISMHQKVARELPVDIIGHLNEAAQGTILITPEGNALPLSSPGWGE
ncbi:MAG: thiamine-phosphate kinase [Prevotellaceae bacterium]|jgi:thiamine-monophosphate kinase|nr:thiamine-phosphate kinase [Prevotellaceae bacterium]